MPKGPRPACIGMYGFEYQCEECEWANECKEMDEAIEQAVTRKGTHVRLTGKYKEKKYKPKTSR
jgi:disulfide oxidoreductase YuzD